MKRSLKKFYPKDITYCIYGDECKKVCKRKISDYELKLIDLYPGKVIEYDPKANEHPIFVKDLGFWDESGNYKEDRQPITQEDLT